MKSGRIAFATVLMIVVMIFSMSAFASSDYKYSALKADKWYNLKEEYPKTVYKVKISDTSIVTINWRGNKNGEFHVVFYADKACSNEAYSTYYIHDTKGLEGFSLSRGTYYVLMENNAGVKSLQAKIRITKAVDKGNYSKAKAVSLAANRTVQIAQSPDCCYTRWYRIKLTKKQSVTITTSDYDANKVFMFGADMKLIKCAKGDSKVVTDNNLSAGTYFIRVVPFAPFSSQYEYENEYAGDYMTLKWR